jgi:hypothetical protein
MVVMMKYYVVTCYWVSGHCQVIYNTEYYIKF